MTFPKLDKAISSEELSTGSDGCSTFIYILIIVYYFLFIILLTAQELGLSWNSWLNHNIIVKPVIIL